jgi:hypothetical protein
MLRPVLRPTQPPTKWNYASDQSPFCSAQLELALLLCLLWLMCFVKKKSPWQADPSTRRVLQSVVCLSVIEEPRTGCIVSLGASSLDKRKPYTLPSSSFPKEHIPQLIAPTINLSGKKPQIIFCTKLKYTAPVVLIIWHLSDVRTNFGSKRYRESQKLCFVLGSPGLEIQTGSQHYS